MTHLIPDDVSADSRVLIQEAYDLWGRLSNVPVIDEEIDEDFEEFESGTSVFEIWTWIEEEFDVSVAWLQGCNVHPVTGTKISRQR